MATHPQEGGVGGKVFTVVNTKGKRNSARREGKQRVLNVDDVS